MDHTVLWFALAGFAAQMVDGCLGMAYGVISNTLLLSLGIHPAAASASVHAAEVFTTGVSGICHFKLGNVDKRIFWRLLIPGVIGGVTGAYLLTAIPTGVIKPVVAAYLLIMGAVILKKSFRKRREKPIKKHHHLLPLGAAGGFLDAIGGGGWGPVVTSTMVAKGHAPRFTIGSVNMAEFFVTLAQSVAFFLTIGLVHWKIITGLIIGGVAAAPISALFCKKVKACALMKIVGVLIILLSLRILYKEFI